MFNTKQKKEMQKAIDLAWSNPSPEHKVFQDLWFPNGKPTVEEFIQKAAEIEKQMPC